MPAEPPSEFPVQYSRSTRLNLVTMGLTIAAALFMSIAPFRVAGLPIWLRLAGSLVSAGLLYSLVSLVQNWDLALWVFPCEIRWRLRGKEQCLSLHHIREFYIEQPRKYRLKYADQSVVQLDFRVLYHAGTRLDGLLPELVSAQLLGTVFHDLATQGRFDFGPVALKQEQSGPLLTVRDRTLPVSNVDLVPGQFVFTVTCPAINSVDSIPMHNIPNVHTLMLAVHMLKSHPLADLCQKFPVHAEHE